MALIVSSFNDVSKETEYTMRCDRYDTQEVKKIKMDVSMPGGLSKIETALGDKAKGEFLKWLDDNNLKNGCWCQQIPIWLKEVNEVKVT